LLIERLASNGWWGEIVGPHGSGKSTLLETLKPALRDAGCCIHAIALREGQRRLPRNLLQSNEFGFLIHRDKLHDQLRDLVLVDGYEQLGRLQRLRLMWRCRRASAGLLVTSHIPVGLPSLVTLVPDRLLIQQLVDSLCRGALTTITAADVSASHASHGGNVRAIFFDLYDRHERLRRAR
jgi:hypothetical protein